MNPRNLRHRLEKASKILVTIQKHAPDVDCHLDEDKGDYGCIVADFAQSEISQEKIVQLGRDLENRGYKFSHKKNPWLGQITYHGIADGFPSVIMTQSASQDRMAISEDAPPLPYSFKATKI